MLITTSITAREAIPQSALRKSLVLQNTDATDIIYIKRERNSALAVTSTDYDIKLGPGASLSLSSLLDGTEAIQDRYTCIASANTPILAVFETEDIKR